jgi:hypothetical protein
MTKTGRKTIDYRRSTTSLIRPSKMTLPSFLMDAAKAAITAGGYHKAD